MKNLKSSVLALCTLSVLSTACIDVGSIAGKKEKSKSSNSAVTNNANTNQIIGDEKVKLQVISESQLRAAIKNGTILPASNAKVRSILEKLPQGEQAESINKSAQEVNAVESLQIGYPLGLVGTQNIFGGVITKVSDKESEDLGTLKLTDLQPIHVSTVISRLPTGEFALTLAGCFNKCDEDSQIQSLISMPILGFDEATQLIIIDMAAIGKELDLIGMLDPTGEYTKLKTVSSDTTEVAYDLETLIFDIKTKMIPVTAQPTDTSAPVTEFTVRWYLKLGAVFTPSFIPRDARPEVGFFATDRSAKNKITRFSTSAKNGQGQPTVKYFIKNVPTEYRKHFSDALDSWNVEFTKTIGRNLLSYEFVEATDPRHAELVPGDIRYNIIEWDLVNKAGYGGLGPSIANQHTGETLSANVLIQGPTIVDLYTKWFGVSKEVRELRAEGQILAANAKLKAFNQAHLKQASQKKSKFTLKLGKNLSMTVQAQRPELQDDIYKGHFEIVPANLTYEKYMEGYFQEMVAHEIGHNLGLRHNFKGNLGAYENGEKGSVSRSIMEYMGRPFRHLNTIGPYDRMAIAYGYKGTAPKNSTWYCTDEDQGDDALALALKSPECTKHDATSDPFSFWEGRITRVLDMVLELKTSTAPIWTTAEVKTNLDEVITGLSAYALSAETTSQTWTNFFGKNDRPDDKKDVKAFVLAKIKKKLCDKSLQTVILSKESAEARTLAEKNLAEVQKAASDKVVELGAYTAAEIACE